jgi:hypothetical protein
VVLVVTGIGGGRRRSGLKPAPGRVIRDEPRPLKAPALAGTPALIADEPV